MPNRKPTAQRVALAVTVAAGLLVVAVLASLAVGSNPLPLRTVIEALVTSDPSPERALVWDSRVPRTLLGLVAGVALGVAGATIQALTRNPLADPGVLGVNAGAAFFVVLAVGFIGVGSIAGYVWFALAGALAATVAVYLIGSGGRRQVNPVLLTLAGVALGAVLTGVSSGLALIRPQAFDSLRAWNLGSVDVRAYEPILVIAPFVAVGLLLAALAARGLNALAMGEDVAHGLGSSVLRTRVASVAAITLLAGSATAATGTIGFVGLMIPHLARWIGGVDQRRIVVLSALLAPALVLIADVIGRVITAGELQVGVVVAFVGAPFLVALASRRRIAAL